MKPRHHFTATLVEQSLRFKPRAQRRFNKPAPAFDPVHLRERADQPGLMARREPRLLQELFLDQNEERFYLEGVTDGFQVLNAALMQKGRQPLYCIPRKVVLYGRDVYELASKDLVGPQENIDLLVSALYGLMKKYPCKE